MSSSWRFWRTIWRQSSYITEVNYCCLEEDIIMWEILVKNIPLRNHYFFSHRTFPSWGSRGKRLAKLPSWCSILHQHLFPGRCKQHHESPSDCQTVSSYQYSHRNCPIGSWLQDFSQDFRSRLCQYFWLIGTQYSICGKTRGGQQCIFDFFRLFFFGGRSVQTWEVERHQRGLNPPTPNPQPLRDIEQCWDNKQPDGGTSTMWRSESRCLPFHFNCPIIPSHAKLRSVMKKMEKLGIGHRELMKRGGKSERWGTGSVRFRRKMGKHQEIG